MKRLFRAILLTVLSVCFVGVFTACNDSANKHKITFIDWDGSTLSVIDVADGEVPVYDGTTPSRAADARYTYTFVGWTGEDEMVYTELPEATANATYTATYNYQERSYTVTFKDGEKVLSTATLKYGAGVAYEGDVPTKDPDAQYTYAFRGWSDGKNEYAADAMLPSVAGDVTYSAVYNETLNSYDIHWVIEGVTTTTSAFYGTVARWTGETPKKQGSEHFSYTFAGWAHEAGGTALTDAQMTVTGEATYYAVFTEDAKPYTVKFLGDGDVVLDEQSLAYGAAINYKGATPTKEATAQYTYTFAGWVYDDTTYGPTETLPNVSGEMTFRATFSQTLNSYEISWNVDGTVTTTTVDYGTVPTYDGTPEKPDDGEYSYVFSGWSTTENGDVLSSLPAVTGKATYYAVFEQKNLFFKVTWILPYETVYTNVDRGEAPVWDKETPHMDPDAQYTYTFLGWSNTENGDIIVLEEQSIISATTYYGVFNKTLNSYQITFVVDGAETNQTLNYGETPDYGSTPEKPSTVAKNYTFLGWSESENGSVLSSLPTVTGNATYYAVFSESTRRYTVTIEYYKGLGDTETAKPSTSFDADYGSMYGKEQTKAEAYDEGGKHYLPDRFWQGGIVEGDVTLKVHYTEADVWDGTAVSTAFVGEGTQTSPYLISSAADLAYLSQVSQGANYGSGKYFELTKSIDLNGKDWKPICDGAVGAYKYFQGSFDGKGYTIAGLYVNRPTVDVGGLFGATNGSAVFKNLVLEGNVTAKTRVGGLVYYVNTANVTVENIVGYVNVSAPNGTYVGGIIGSTDGTSKTLLNLTNYGSVTATSGATIGGIIGNIKGSTITNAVNYGTVSGAGNDAGGIMGVSNMTVSSNCVNYGNVSSTGGERVGGIAGNSFGAGNSVTSCVNYGNITGVTVVGGIAGHNTQPFSSNKNYGTITSSGNSAGGLIGFHESTAIVMSDCINYGDVVCGGENGGGIGGKINLATLQNCVNYGNISGARYTGGICGNSTTVTATGCENFGDVSALSGTTNNVGFAGIIGWTTTSSVVSDCHNHGNITANSNVGGICGYLGAGSTCEREGENACTNDGVIKGSTYADDLVGYDKNVLP